MSRQRAVRRRLVERFGMRCAYCWIALHHDRGPVPTVDHIVPRSAGGSNQFGNLALACSPCQREKGAQPPVGRWYPRYRVTVAGYRRRYRRERSA